MSRLEQFPTGTLDYVKNVLEWAQDPYAPRIMVDPRYADKFIAELRASVTKHTKNAVDTWVELLKDDSLIRRPRDLLRAAEERHVLPTRPGRFGGFPLNSVRSFMHGPQSTFWFGSQYATEWRQRGRVHILVSANGVMQCQKKPEQVVELYERFPSASLTQEWLVAACRKHPDLKSHSGKKITLKTLGRVPNAELRRCVVQVYGLSLPKPEQKDDYGELYILDNAVHVIHVTCPSTGRKYFLGVPAACSTAREGVLWSFGLREVESGVQVSGTWIRHGDVGLIKTDKLPGEQHRRRPPDELAATEFKLLEQA